MAERHDYAFPFRIDPESRQAQRATYEDHVMQMVKQLLLTAPGERVNLPEFGCGLRAMIFAGNSETVAAAAEMLVRQALTRWLSEHLVVEHVRVTADVDQAVLDVEVHYKLTKTFASQRTELQVR